MSFTYSTGEPDTDTPPARQNAKLLQNPPPGLKDKDNWKISIVNLHNRPLAPVGLETKTLEYIVAEAEVEDKYLKLFAELYAFYSDWNERNIGIIPTERFENVKYGVLYMPNELITFQRVQIIASYFYIKGNRTSSPILTRLKLMDYPYGPEETLKFDPDTMKLFYLTLDFILLEPRVKDNLLIDGTQPLCKYIEFWQILQKRVRPGDIYNAVVKNRDIIKNTVAVELRSENEKYPFDNAKYVYRATVNQPRFGPKIPQTLGEKHKGYRFSHIDEDGTVYIRPSSTQEYRFFEAVQYEVPIDKIEDIVKGFKAMAPCPLKPDKRYIAFFEGGYYRCIVDFKNKPEKFKYEVGPGEVMIYFIDYGNRVICKKEDLIPCALINENWSYFKPQVFEARLNVENVKFEYILHDYPEEICIAVLEPAMKSNDYIPLIEIIHEDTTSEEKVDVIISKKMIESGHAVAREGEGSSVSFEQKVVPVVSRFDKEFDELFIKGIEDMEKVVNESLEYLGIF